MPHCPATPQTTGLMNRQRLALLPKPHVGSATVTTRDAMGFRALDNVDALFAGDIPKDLL